MVTVTIAPDRPEVGEVLLEVENLSVEFDTDAGIVRAVTDVSFSVAAGETVAIIGESGSGKSVTAMAVMGIVPSPPGRITSTAIRYRGRDLSVEKESRRRKVRGEQIAMIFQDPLAALNPVYSVGWQIGESLRVRRGWSRKDAKERAIELMDFVEIPEARRRVNDYPHQFSGGMRQRVMIAMALSLEPAILIADEPTTALDVTVQAQIIGLLERLQEETNMGLILITHDLGVVATVADRVHLMYGGRLMEKATADEFYAAPAHPYARALMGSIPRISGGSKRLVTISGQPPSLVQVPTGCSFHPRCPYAQERCRVEIPELRRIAGYAGEVACHFSEDLRGEWYGG
jgi:oligopeptide transport system ATP-binding protein